MLDHHEPPEQLQMLPLHPTYLCTGGIKHHFNKDVPSFGIWWWCWWRVRLCPSVSGSNISEEFNKVEILVNMKAPIHILAILIYTHIYTHTHILILYYFTITVYPKCILFIQLGLCISVYFLYYIQSALWKGGCYPRFPLAIPSLILLSIWRPIRNKRSHLVKGCHLEVMSHLLSLKVSMHFTHVSHSNSHTWVNTKYSF